MFDLKSRLFGPSLILVLLVAAAPYAGSSLATPSDALVASQQQWLAGWRETSPMQAGRTGAAVHAERDVIHMLGGMGSAAGSDGAIVVQMTPGEKMFLSTTEHARVKADGTLSPWSLGPAMSMERGFFSAISHNGNLYAVGGARGPNGSELLNSVERAEIKADGTLGDWVLEKGTLNNPRRCAKLTVIGDYIYAFGGYGGILLDTLERAQINPDGSLGEWLVITDRMTVARYVHGVERVGDGVYNIGGHSKEGGGGIVDVEWGRVDAEGFFSPWRSITPLQTGRFSLATAQHGEFLYAIGGLNGAAHLDSIERAHIDGAGDLSAWEYTTPAPAKMSGANALVINESIYLIGGNEGDGPRRSVYYANFNKQGDIGFLATSDEIDKYRARAVAREANKPPFPHSALIVEHIKKKLYSYLKVREDNGNVFWLAAPAQDLKEGERISFPNGTLMKDFRSKNLQRTFPFILFIRDIRQYPG
ncbi:MAG: hypothetical protein L3J28_06170 [Candidatus Polarisedimenticolaceae bacterium]|nr:hypothetical protein [Candidatus Polarisedimenticolaceae bacterium]